jgi:hypothetical protein
MTDGSLRKAREELRKQFNSLAEAIANRPARSPSILDMDQLVRLRQAIDTLDHAIANHWDREAPHQDLRPPEDDPYLEMHELPELPGDERG